MSQPIGIVGEVSKPTEVDIKALTPIPPGTYIYIKFKARDRSSFGEEVDREVVGIIGSCLYRSVVPVLTTPNLPMYETTSLLRSLKSESYMKAVIIADISRGRADNPEYPPPPETPVYLAELKHLKTIYDCEPGAGVEVGSLVGFNNLRISVNVNSLAKHLLITGTTGSGKSNLVAVLADRIAQVGGSVAIFDVHGEYGNLVSEDPDNVSVVVYDAAINPVETPVSLLTNFIIPEGAATRQRRILKNALRKLNDEILGRVKMNRKPYAQVVKEIFKEGSPSNAQVEDPKEAYKEVLKKYLRDVGHDGDSDKTLADVEDKIDDFFEWHRISLEARKVSEVVGNGKIVVIDVSTFTDDDKDFMLKVVAEDLLWYLKEGGRGTERAPIPTLLVVEEAHIFLGSGVNTKSKGVLQRFIREGRKFGGMLAVVSQRPRALDVNVVSQVQSYAFLKLVQKDDKSTVMELTDILGDEYVEILPTLPPGHAILMGEWIGKYPAYIRVDRHLGKRAGVTPEIVKIWREGRESIGKALERRSLIKEWEA